MHCHVYYLKTPKYKYYYTYVIEGRKIGQKAKDNKV